MSLLLAPLNFEGVVEVNNLVDEPSSPTPILQPDCIPKLKVRMEYPKSLQLKDPIDQTPNPGEKLFSSCLLEKLNVVFATVSQNKIIRSLFKDQRKAFAIIVGVLAN